MDERLRFVARLLDGEKMAVLRREFDISRKTGYKIFSRYKDCGMEGLTDRSRRPYRHANRLPFQVEKLIVQLKKEHPTWGAPKIREKIKRRHTEVSLPAISTIHTVLDGHGLSAEGAEPGTRLKAPRSSSPRYRMIFGARTTRVSSCSQDYRASSDRFGTITWPSGQFMVPVTHDPGMDP
jgi:transposase